MRLPLTAKHARLALASIAPILCAGPALGAPPPSEFDEPPRVVAIGFIGGQIAPMREALRNASVIDENGDWIAEDTHLVFLGDVTHFGDEVLECVDLIRSLERQAAESSGMVHMLIGRAEFMMLRGDLTTLEPPNYEHMVNEESQARLEGVLARWRAELSEYNADENPPYRQMLNDRFADRFWREYAPGAVEWMDLFAPGAERGDWLRSRNAVVKIGELLYSHAGVGPEWALDEDLSLEQINERVRAEMNKPGVWVPKMAELKGPVWYRDYLAEDVVNLVNDRALDTLRRYRATGQVIGASPILGESLVRGRIYHVGSGLTQELDADVIVSAMDKSGSNMRFCTNGTWFNVRAVGSLPAPKPDEPAPPTDEPPPSGS